MQLRNLWSMGMSVLVSCTSYKPFNEIKHIGFDKDVRQGKSVGQITGGDCSYRILSYWLSGQPDVNSAIQYARVGKKASIGDKFGGAGVQGDGVRYLTNVRYEYSGFDFVLLAQNCIEVTGKGYK
jgi:hypothetical protein